MSSEALAAELEIPEPESLWQRLKDNFRSGNLGSWPVIAALWIIVAVFWQTAPNFATPANFTNLITQMAGTCLLAYGVVFVLLIGEIDLSVAFVSGIAGVVAARLQEPTGADLPWYICIALALAATTAIGAFQGSIVALIGVPSFVVTLAGFEIWQGVIQEGVPGVIVIQDEMINNSSNYFFGDRAGWIMAAVISVSYVGGMVAAAISQRRHGIKLQYPVLWLLRLVIVPLISFVTVYILNKDRGVPFALLLVVGGLVVWTFIAKKTKFGRHVYAVGGNAEAARRAGINVSRIRILVFMISGFMAGMGGIVLAARLNSVDLNAGGGTLLINAIAAAVIGGTSLFGGVGRVVSALLGALVITAITNGMDLLGLASGTKFVITGLVLLAAVLVDAYAKRRRAARGVV